MVDSEREVCGSVRVGGKNDDVKVVVKRMQATWKEMFGARGEYARERFRDINTEVKRKVKAVYIRAKRRLINSKEGR